MGIGHHGHVIQIIWICIIPLNQLYFIGGIKALVINLCGILVTLLYSNHISKIQYTKATGENSYW